MFIYYFGCLIFRLLNHVKLYDVEVRTEFIGHSTGTDYLPLLML